MIPAHHIRQARAFLQRHGLTTKDVRPAAFALAAAQMGATFAKTLKTLAQLQMHGQGLGPAPIAQEVAEDQASET